MTARQHEPKKQVELAQKDKKINWTNIKINLIFVTSLLIILKIKMDHNIINYLGVVSQEFLMIPIVLGISIYFLSLRGIKSLRQRRSVAILIAILSMISLTVMVPKYEPDQAYQIIGNYLDKHCHPYDFTLKTDLTSRRLDFSKQKKYYYISYKFAGETYVLYMDPMTGKIISYQSPVIDDELRKTALSLPFRGGGYKIDVFDIQDYKKMNDFLFAGLFRIDENGNAIKDLVSDFSVSEDGLRWEFILKDNSRWSDNTEIKAEDWVHSWQQIRQQNPDYFNYYAQIGNLISQRHDPLEIEAKSSNKLVLKLKKPHHDLPSILSGESFKLYLKKSSVGDESDLRDGKLDTKPVKLDLKATQERHFLELEQLVTSGPYEVSDTFNYEIIDLTPNKNYHDHRHLYFDEVSFRSYTDSMQITEALIQGDIDICENNILDTRSLNESKSNPRDMFADFPFINNRLSLKEKEILKVSINDALVSRERLVVSKGLPIVYSFRIHLDDSQALAHNDTDLSLGSLTEKEASDLRRALTQVIRDNPIPIAYFGNENNKATKHLIPGDVFYTSTYEDVVDLIEGDGGKVILNQLLSDVVADKSMDESSTNRFLVDDKENNKDNKLTGDNKDNKLKGDNKDNKLKEDAENKKNAENTDNTENTENINKAEKKDTDIVNLKYICYGLDSEKKIFESLKKYIDVNLVDVNLMYQELNFKSEQISDVECPYITLEGWGLDYLGFKSINDGYHYFVKDEENNEHMLRLLASDDFDFEYYGALEDVLNAENKMIPLYQRYQSYFSTHQGLYYLKKGMFK